MGSAVSKLLLAACAVGVGASFSAPIGGVTGAGLDIFFDFLGTESLSSSHEAHITTIFVAELPKQAQVIFALELMLPQTYDAFAYWGCFTAGVVGAITYAVERTLTSGAAEILPLISSNVLPGEGSEAWRRRCLKNLGQKLVL